MNQYLILTTQLLLALSSSSSRTEAFVPRNSPASIAKPTTALQSKADERDPVAMARLSLEMHWNLDQAATECQVEKPETCGSEECTDCSGTGQTVCRFCRGTQQNYYNGNFAKCPVCHSGMEVCRPCKGTGWIAEWTQLTGEQLMP